MTLDQIPTAFIDFLAEQQFDDLQCFRSKHVANHRESPDEWTSQLVSRWLTAMVGKGNAPVEVDGLEVEIYSEASVSNRWTIEIDRDVKHLQTLVPEHDHQLTDFGEVDA